VKSGVDVCCNNIRVHEFGISSNTTDTKTTRIAGCLTGGRRHREQGCTQHYIFYGHSVEQPRGIEENSKGRAARGGKIGALSRRCRHGDEPREALAEEDTSTMGAS
jgi:hypothetical protein